MEYLSWVLQAIVFAICDSLDALLCPVFRFLDWHLDKNNGSPPPCHCHSPNEAHALGRYTGNEEFWANPSHTLYDRRMRWKRQKKKQKEEAHQRQQFVNMSKKKKKQRSCWSDCSCETCTAWITREPLLYVHADCQDFSTDSSSAAAAVQNVIFIHGFLSSSSFWVDTVLPHLSKELRSSYRLFAIDVLGFGKSPRPDDSLYTNAEHVEMIRRSVLEKYGIRSFHLVAHSMGCTIAVALAGNNPSAVQSITMLAPLYFPTRPGVPPSSYVLSNVAPQKVWPFFAFVHALMSWYEHLGRVVCLVFCKHHRFWIPLMTFFARLSGSSMPPSFVHDYMQHSHHSAFKMFHNTICAGPFVMEHSMAKLAKAGRHVHVIHGEDDATCSVECGVALTRKFPNVTLARIPGAGHMSVVLGREREIARELEAQILGGSNDCMEPHVT